MHKIILQTKAKRVDHRDHNTLDNRRGNLRPCDDIRSSQNRGLRRDNKSGFKGVVLMKWRNKVKPDQRRWVANITNNKRAIYLGCFTSARDAAKAYDKAAKKYHGEFARLNFPTTL